MDMQQYLDPELINTCAIAWGIRIVSALAISCIGRWVIKLLPGLVQRVMNGAGPAPATMPGELAESCVNLKVRPWVKSGDYRNVRSDLLENIKLTFDQNCISRPSPQRDVHMHNSA